MAYNLEWMKKRMEELGIDPKRSLGQNFLVNTNACEKIVGRAIRYLPMQVVEVGPGLGALTEILKNKNQKPLLIELDHKIAQFWREQGFEVIEEDALRADWALLLKEQTSILISNLPYQISSRLLVDRSVGPQCLRVMILMFQKEVAQRLMAKPRTADYGFLSVIGQTFWKMERLMELSSKDFYPPPKVASQVLVFERRESPLDSPFIRFIKDAFQQRRKLLVSNLSNWGKADVIRELLITLGHNEKSRAEELSSSSFHQLYDALQKP